jgi:putative heme transporter
MPDEQVTSRARVSRRDVIRYLVGLLIGAVVLAVLFGKRGDLVAARHQLGHLDVRWVLAGIAAESASLLTFAWLQRRVLRLSGSAVALPGLFLLTMANDAIANTVPGEPAVSSAYRYRWYRRNGASGASAGWTVFTILIAQAIGMSALLLLGVLVALAGATSTSSAGVAVLGLVIVLASGAVLVRRDLVLRLLAALVRGVRWLTGRRRTGSGGAGTEGADKARQRGGPAAGLGERIESTLARMREIPLSGRASIGVVAMATAVWGCDFGCLLCGFGAVHASVPWHGVLLAYGAAVVAGSLPIVPGGLGIIEGSLAVILVAYGAGRGQAISAALAFRLVNFWFAIAAGWICVGVIGYQLRRARGPEPTAADTTATAAAAEGSEVPEGGLEPVAEG